MDDQELDRLYTAVRDHKAAYEAAVGVIGRQNDAIARVRALHAQAAGAANPWCGRCHDVAPCPTVQALNA